MAIPESQLEAWSHQGSVTQSSETYATIKRALEAPDTKYADKIFEVFLQGSYGNDTNVYAESDVDIVIRLDSIYFYDTSDLTPTELAIFNSEFISATYSYAEYRSHVIDALKVRFGATAVTAGEKAVKIKADGNRRSADVVVATEYRHYYSGGLRPLYHRGICIFTPSGYQIINYPQQHAAHCTEKHQGTNQWFKPTVRVLKNMRNRLLKDGAIGQKCAPSYFVEGLLYNVPNEMFGSSYADTFVRSINWIAQVDRNRFVCPNHQHYLVRDNIATCWPCGNFNMFLNGIIGLWNSGV